MGEPFRARSMRLSDQQLRWIDEIRDVVPMLSSRTAVVGWASGAIWEILTTPSILRSTERAFQDAGRSFYVRPAYDTTSSLGEGSKPGPSGVTRPREHGRPGCSFREAV